MVDIEMEWLRYTAVSKRKWKLQWDSSEGSGLRGVLFDLYRSPDGQLAHDFFYCYIRLVRWWIVGCPDRLAAHIVHREIALVLTWCIRTQVITLFHLYCFQDEHECESDLVMEQTWLRVVGDEPLLQCYWRGPNSKKISWISCTLEHIPKFHREIRQMVIGVNLRWL